MSAPAKDEDREQDDRADHTSKDAHKMQPTNGNDVQQRIGIG
jgi:hypothetical protein